MILSNNQKILVAKLNQVKENPTECYQIGFENDKTVEIINLLQREQYISVDEDEQTIELDEQRFNELATENGILDETGTLTSEGTELADKTIEEGYGVLLKLMKHVSF